jgi:hypothetical protein
LVLDSSVPPATPYFRGRIRASVSFWVRDNDNILLIVIAQNEMVPGIFSIDVEFDTPLHSRLLKTE